MFLSWSALASLKPQAAPGIVPGAAMPAALSKIISQNLQTLSKMISIQSFLIFKKVFHHLSLSITALASLKPQAASGIVSGAAMPAALWKMISQNLQALSKMISIQWLLIFKTVFLHLFLLISLGLAEAPGCTRHRIRGSHASCFVKDDFTKATNIVKDDFISMTPDI